MQPQAEPKPDQPPAEPQTPAQPAPDTVIAPTSPTPPPAEPSSQSPPPPAPPSQPSAVPPSAPAPKADQQPAQPSQAAPPPAAANPKARVPNTLPVTEPGERTVCVVKRHPIGIIGTYVMAATVAIVAAAFAFIVIPDFISDKGQATIVGTLLFLIVAMACAVFVTVARKVYWGNSWTVTTDSLTQVRRSGLFDRQSSQLSLKDLEDVTAAQDGVLARMLNYGLLRVETAGERSKFMFPFCPNPNYYAQQILAAREAFERNRMAEEGPAEQKTP